MGNQVYDGMSCTVGVDYDTLVGCLWPCDLVLCKHQWSSVPRQPTSSIQGICQVQCPCPVSALFTKCAFWFYHSCKCQQMWVLNMCQIQIFGYIILIESSIFSVNPASCLTWLPRRMLIAQTFMWCKAYSYSLESFVW